MTTENLKAVLTDEEIGRVRHVAMIAEGAKSENPKTFSGCIVSFFYHTVLEILSIIERLAREVVRLREDPLTVFTEPEETARLKDTIRELEAQVTALKKLDDDNNADSVRRLKQMEEDKRTIKELEADADEYKDVIKTANQTALDYMDKYKKAQAKLKAWEDAPMVEVSGQGLVDYTGDYALDGTYHLKPKGADDAQGN